MKTRTIRIIEDDYYKLKEMKEVYKIPFVHLISKAIQLLFKNQKED